LEDELAPLVFRARRKAPGIESAACDWLVLYSSSYSFSPV
jgi:hypothetical protein